MCVVKYNSSNDLQSRTTYSQIFRNILGIEMNSCEFEVHVHSPRMLCPDTGKIRRMIRKEKQAYDEAVARGCARRGDLEEETSSSDDSPRLDKNLLERYKLKRSVSGEGFAARVR